jgi:hypothetical protein
MNADIFHVLLVFIHFQIKSKTWKTQRGDGGITPTHSQPGTRRRWVVSTTIQPLYPRERPSTYCVGGWVDLGAGLDPTEILSPDC